MPWPPRGQAGGSVLWCGAGGSGAHPRQPPQFSHGEPRCEHKSSPCKAENEPYEGSQEGGKSLLQRVSKKENVILEKEVEIWGSCVGDCPIRQMEGAQGEFE